jgi:alkylation response protein AidB-like acyl-CoA dehydrogenase
VEIVEHAQRFADDVLFPAALTTDAADVVPRELLDRLAAEDLYAVGADADFPTICAVQEALASGCLTTAFVWAQHLGLVHVLAAGNDDDLRARWLGPLLRGDVRAGLALGGALPQPTLHARRHGDAWVLDGISPFLSGWGMIDVVHTAARTADDQIVWLVVDAVESDALRVDRLRLVALDATATVRASFAGLRVDLDRQTTIHPTGGETPPEVLRLHASLALGVASRCCRLLGPSPLDEELAALRTDLDDLGPETAARRAAAGELAVRAAAALAASSGSRTLLLADQAQRLWREALFVLVYALRPASRDALVARLGAA